MSTAANKARQLPASVDGCRSRPPCRRTSQPNAWIAEFEDARPALRLSWPSPQRIARIELCFDTDFDHPMESVLMGHPERAAPFDVRCYGPE